MGASSLTSTPARKGVAGVVLALVLVAAALMAWTTREKIRLQRSPITLSLAVDAHVWLGFGDTLHRLAADGSRVQRVTLDELRLPTPLSHLHAVRNDDLLVAAGEPTRLYRCVVSALACRLVDQGYVDAHGAFKRAVWIGANAAGTRVVVTDNARHRVAVLDADGRLLAAAGGAVGRFHFPAQPVWIGDDEVWIADADHHRIERLRWREGLTVLPAADLAVETPNGHPVAGASDWPLALAPMGDGAWWAVIQQDMIKPGGLYGITPEGSVARRAELPAGADLTGVTRLDDKIVVSDLNGPRLWQLTLQGADAAPFGDAAITAELHATQQRLARIDALQTGSRWALVALPLAGLVALLALGERLPAARVARPPASKDRSVPAHVEGPLELRLLAGPRRITGVLAAILVLLAVVIAVTVGIVAFSANLAAMGTRAFAWLALLSVVTLAASCVMALVLTRIRNTTLTLGGESVFVHHTRKLIAAAKLHDCWTDGRALLVDGHLVSLVSPVGLALYDREAVQRYLLPHVPADRWLSPARLQWRALRALAQRHPIVMLLLVGVLVALLGLRFALPPITR